MFEEIDYRVYDNIIFDYVTLQDSFNSLCCDDEACKDKIIDVVDAFVDNDACKILDGIVVVADSNGNDAHKILDESVDIVANIDDDDVVM